MSDSTTNSSGSQGTDLATDLGNAVIDMLTGFQLDVSTPSSSSSSDSSSSSSSSDSDKKDNK